jgi:hypothetical protein
MSCRAWRSRPRRLSKPVERLVQLVHLALFALDDESRRLFDVNFLYQVPIQERRLHVEVVHRPPTMCGNGEDEPHRLQACNRRKDFVEINAGAKTFFRQFFTQWFCSPQ